MKLADALEKDQSVIDKEYSQLSDDVRRSLNDWTNQFMGLFGYLDEGEEFFDVFVSRIRDGKIIPTSFYWRPWMKPTDHDKKYIAEIEQFLLSINEALKEVQKTQNHLPEQVRKAIRLMMRHYFYGNTQ